MKPMQYDADYFIRQLELTRHIEGGWYRETYRSPEIIGAKALPGFLSGSRNISTSIFFLLENEVFSAFHRIKSDEIWHFYAGDGLIIYELLGNGELMQHQLGSDPSKGQSFQAVIKAGNWFASRVLTGSGFALCGCTVAPGFDFADFELANKARLLEQFPRHSEIIESFCR